MFKVSAKGIDLTVKALKKFRGEQLRRSRAVSSSTAFHLSNRLKKMVRARLKMTAGTRWLMRGIRYRKARPGVAARIFVMPKQARYLTIHIRGGQRRNPWPIRLGNRKPAAEGVPVWLRRRRARRALTKGGSYSVGGKKVWTLPLDGRKSLTTLRGGGKRQKSTAVVLWVPRASYRTRIRWRAVAERGFPIDLRKATRDVNRRFKGGKK